MAKPIWLITGGAGFIGSNIAEALLKKGERVRIIDDFSTGKLSHIASFKSKVDLRRGNIQRPADLKKAMKGVTYVLHQAALRSVPKSVDQPSFCNDNNVTGTLNVLMAAKQAKVKRLVYASSSSVYGDAKVFPQKETFTPAPVSPYAVSKLAGEHYTLMFAKTYGLETVALRYFNVFGPKQDPESIYSAVIPRFMEQAILGQTLEVHWDGRQERDFTYIDNVVQANLLAATRPGVSGQAFNVANGRTYSLLKLISIIEDCVGRRLKRHHTPMRAGDVRKTYADISKARRLLGYKPPVGFEDGVRRTWAWFSADYKAK